MPLISYARNLEDVMLWRALKHVAKGAYVDFSAQDPLIDSVSLAFYEMGWRGAHVTNSEHGEKLKTARPDEQVHITAYSTDLADVFGKNEIHWARVTSSMLDGLCNHSVRPWIILVENAHPTDDALLREKGYDFVYFDGFNRFYVSRQHPELVSAFSSPPNCLDDFTLSGKASSGFCSLLNSRIAELEHEVQALHALNAANIEKLSNRLLERHRKWASHLVERMSSGKTTFPEAARLNPRARRIYAELKSAMEGKA